MSVNKVPGPIPSSIPEEYNVSRKMKYFTIAALLAMATSAFAGTLVSKDLKVHRQYWLVFKQWKFTFFKFLQWISVETGITEGLLICNYIADFAERCWAVVNSVTSWRCPTFKAHRCRGNHLLQHRYCCMYFLLS
jgi:hypothetical protein